MTHLNGQQEGVEAGLVRETRVGALAQQQLDGVDVVVVRGPKERRGLQFPTQ